MAVRKLIDRVYEVGAIDWHRQLFDDLIPLHEGTSYNSYLVIGTDKIALIDAVDPKFKDTLLENLVSLNVKNIDYIICNHAEQDHSGAIPYILNNYPNAKVVTNQKCKQLLMDLLLIPENKFIIIEDRQTLSLGNFTLEFIFFPWVHWPETFLTYLKEERILFTCDLFGSHVANSDLFAKDTLEIYNGAIRYFAEIMYPFRKNINANFNKITELPLNIIAPSHGPVYNKPEIILSLYKDWISEKLSNKVIIAYVSMHGSIEKISNFLIKELTESFIKVIPFNLTYVDIGYLATELIDTPTFILAAPAVLNGVHPYAIYASYLVNLLRPEIKYLGIIGSYGWGSKLIEQIQSIFTNIKPELLPNIMIKGYPKENDFEKLKEFVSLIKEKHKNLGIY